MTRRIVLVRHGEVTLEARDICYGAMDVELSARGLLRSQEIADALSAWPLEIVWHSNLRRTRVLAEFLAAKTGARCVIAPELRERGFGDWEGQRWGDIYRTTGAAMDGMIAAPDTFRPGGGETTFEMRDRILAWFRSLPETGTFAAISHGGPIAALLGTLEGRSPSDWPKLIPAVGMWVEVSG